jgi:RimJ/RimL family protein N-acetyltransferase
MAPEAAAGAVAVRELRWTDFDPLREMYYLLYEERETNPEIGITLFRERPSYEDETAWFSGLYRRALAGDAVVRIAELEARVIGNCVVGREGPSPSAENGHVGVLGILVHRDFRGRGAGDALLRSTLAGCRGTFDLVRLSVFAANARARRLYERHGFVGIGRVPAGVRRGDQYLDEDLMLRDLRTPPPKR